MSGTAVDIDAVLGRELELTGAGEHRRALNSTALRTGLQRIAIATVGLALLAFAFVPFVISAFDAARHHAVFMGVSGFFPIDQLQYLAFVSDAHTGLIRNLFGVRGAAVFVDPMWSPAGIVQGLTGLGPVAIMAITTLAGAATLFAGAWRLVTAHISAERPGRRVLALALALFGGLTPILALLYHSDARWVGGFALDLVPAITAWGYAPTAVAVGLMPFAILGIERLVAGTATRRSVAVTAACCLGIGWLHPWQAAVVLLVLVASVAWRALDAPSTDGTAAQRAHRLLIARRAQLSAVIAALAAGPLYFELLGRLDDSWANFSRADAKLLMLNGPILAYAVLPLLLIGLVAVRAARGDRRLRVLILWLVATVAVVALRPPEQFHALDGVALPLGVLLVRVMPDLRRAPVRSLAVSTLIASLIGTTLLFGVELLRYSRTHAVTQYSELSANDAKAVRLAAASDRGAMVLTSAELGAAVPALADVPTWAGDPLWTPGGFARDAGADAFISGALSPARGRAYVSRTGAGAVVQPCGYTYDLEPTLQPLGFTERTVGCARVYVRHLRAA